MAQNNATPKKSKKGGMNALVTIIILLILAHIFFYFVIGSSSNFENGDTSAHPLNFMGIIYKGGVIIPFLITFFLIVIVFSIERFFTLKKAAGKTNLAKFVTEVKSLINSNEIDEAISLCDAQKGSVGNVVREGLVTYKALSTDTTMDKDQKLIVLAKTLDEATILELPALEKNTTIISTIASVGTLIALMGTVIGMIKSFFALGEGGGTPDAAALSVGIAEALINTGMGIGASALAIIAYNMITSKIDDITFTIDEVGMTIQQAFSANH